MSKSKRDLTPDEKKLWRRVAATVKARRPRVDPVEADEPPVAAKALSRAAPAKPAPEAKPAPRAAVAPPQNRQGEKRVRRGKLEIGRSLDLHGHTQDSARAALGRFLRASQKRGDSTVIVITGVGRGGEGVLKRRFPEWLAESDLRPLISGFAPAHRMHGGAGAFYVFLKRAKETPA